MTSESSRAFRSAASTRVPTQSLEERRSAAGRRPRKIRPARKARRIDGRRRLVAKPSPGRCLSEFRWVMGSASDGRARTPRALKVLDTSDDKLYTYGCQGFD